MARAIATEENGRSVILVDVDQYGGDKLSIAQACGLMKNLSEAIHEAKRNRARIQNVRFG